MSTSNAFKIISSVINFPSHEFTVLSKWFYNNFVALNPSKCSFVLLGVDDELKTDSVWGNGFLKKSK